MSNFEKCIIEEIDMILECYFEEKIELTDNQKLMIASDIINNEEDLWETFNNVIVEHIEKEIENE